jgi:nucleoside-diphosphate-sugar epimerase
MAGNGKRIVFTGGSGKAGRHVIPYLQAQGYQVLNVDLIDFPDPSAGVFTLKADLTDSGQVFNALTSHYNFAGYEGPNNASPPDAVIHFAAYARNMLVPVRLPSTFTPASQSPIPQLPVLTYNNRTTNATAAT